MFKWKSDLIGNILTFFSVGISMRIENKIDGRENGGQKSSTYGDETVGLNWFQIGITGMFLLHLKDVPALIFLLILIQTETLM